MRNSPSQHPSRNELRSHKTDTDGFIVGVRGTSIALSKNATNTQLAIVDSTKSSTGIAAVITCRAASDSGAFYRGTQFSAYKYSTGSVANAVCLENLTHYDNPAQIYASQKWIRANTVQDLAYLAVKALYASPDQKSRIEDEMTSSTPTDTGAIQALLSATVTEAGNVKDADNENNGDTTLSDDAKKRDEANRRTCKNSETYLP